jgi:DNA polymerase-4
MRKIIHIDMDAFFAAVEMRDNPELRNVPMAVGGSRDERGVISTSNYLARKFGVRSAMPTALARKLCPNLIVVRGRMSVYKEVSDQVFDIFYQYTDLVEGLSWDEGYLDVTNSPFCQNSATLMAREIRQKIFEKTGGLTASAGIAPNKLMAKMASDFNKPNGQFTVAPENVDEFIKTIPVEKLWGVGKVTAGIMHKMGIKTCHDLQTYSRSDLIHHFGKFGDLLFDFCRGIDERKVETEYERKSLGTEETFVKDLKSFDEMKSHVQRMVLELQEALEDYPERKIKNLHVKIKYFDFKSTTIERQLPFNGENFLQLLEDRWAQDPRPVRLLGVGVKFENTDEEVPLLPLFDGPFSLS